MQKKTNVSINEAMEIAGFYIYKTNVHLNSIFGTFL